MRGIDLYEGAGSVDWAALGDVGFAIVKATEGATIRDARFAGHWPAIKKAGIIRGAYHFFYAASSTPQAQAESFLVTVGTLVEGDLPPVLDIEEASLQDVAPATVIAHAQTWLDYVGRRLRTPQGKPLRPIVYTNFDTWQQLGNPDGFADYPLWIASPGGGEPDIPVPFGRNDWLLRQTAFDQEHVGVSERVDLDISNTFERGSTGARVREVQQRLKSLLAESTDPGPVDGLFGPKTDSAVRAFQRTRRLSVDGIVDLKTWVELIWS
jgi:lysozyme